ncbi:MAG TPA: hypothetical protein VM261_19110 [Kofleriaceae bacterium]|nr:hypothetical protein [Kofleriaceae bacterium]
MSRWSAGRIAKWAVLALIIGWPLYVWLKPREDFDLHYARGSKNAEGLVRYVDDGGNAGKVRGDLKKHHKAARAKLAAAGAKTDAPIGALLDAMLAAVENRVVLEMPAAMTKTDRASFDAVAALLASPGSFVAPISHHLDEPGYSCAKGFEAAFQGVFGKESDVVRVEIARFIEAVDRGRPVLTIAWSARAGTSAYARANGKRVYPSLVVDAEVTLRARAGGDVVAALKGEARPATEISWTTYGYMPALDLMYPDSDSSDGDVFGGIVASTCESLGQQLIAKLTGVTPAGPAAGGDAELAHDTKWCKEENDAASCARLGLRYRDGVGVAVDKAKAEELLYEACNGGLGAGAEACAPAAQLTLARTGDLGEPMNEARTSVILALEEGCQYHATESCTALGDLRSTLYRDDGGAVPEYSAREAAMAYLHACDLGEPIACDLGAKALAPFDPLQARLLAARGCAGGREDSCSLELRLERIAAKVRTVFDVDLPKGDAPFDIHWATLFDGDETPTIWVASRSTPDALAQTFAAQIYRGTVIVNPPGTSAPPPAWAKSTYLVGKGPTTDYHQKCPACPHGSLGLSLMRCTCLP